MADIKLECPQCGAFFQISEYVDSTRMSCPQCDTELDIEASTVKENGLRVRKDALGTGHEAPPVDEPPEKQVPLTKKEARQQEKVANKKDPYAKSAPKPWQGIAALIFALLVFVGMQYAGHNDILGAGWYFKMRIVVYPLLYIMVLVAAFNEGYLPGILCLLLPPYLIYYAVSRTDSYAVRGAFVAMLIAMGAEMAYQPDRAFITHVEKGVFSVIDGGADFIERTGNSGVEFE